MKLFLVILSVTQLHHLDKIIPGISAPNVILPKVSQDVQASNLTLQSSCVDNEGNGGGMFTGAPALQSGGAFTSVKVM